MTKLLSRALWPSPHYSFVGIGLFLVIPACGPPDGAESGLVLTERDSAGVRILELPDVYESTLPQWRVSASPRLTISAVAGPPEHTLFNVVGATTLRDGDMAVANAGTSEVRIFDSDGQFLRAFGRDGRGPGEFNRMAWLGRAGGDTVVVFDSGLRRATWFTEGGELVRTSGRIDPWVDLPQNATQYGIMGIAAVGVAQERLLVRADYLRRTAEGEYRDTFFIAVSDTSGPLDPLAQYAGEEVFWYITASGMPVGQVPIFGRDTRVASSTDRMVVGSTDRFELEVYDDAALTMKIISWIDLSPASTSEVESWLEDRRQWAGDLDGDFGEAMLAATAHLPVRETPPAFQQLAVDRSHGIWIAESSRVPTPVLRWIVLGADGTPEARVDLATDLTILEIGEDYIVALRRDELDVEHVLVYALERSY